MLSEDSEGPMTPHGLRWAVRPRARQAPSLQHARSAQVLSRHLRTQGTSERLFMLPRTTGPNPRWPEDRQGPGAQGSPSGVTGRPEHGHTCPWNAYFHCYVICFPRLLQVYTGSFSLTIYNQKDARKGQGQGVWPGQEWESKSPAQPTAPATTHASRLETEPAPAPPFAHTALWQVPLSPQASIFSPTKWGEKACGSQGPFLRTNQMSHGRRAACGRDVVKSGNGKDKWIRTTGSP